MYASIGPQQDQPYSIALVSATAGTLAAVAGVAGQSVRVYKLYLFCGGSTNITFQDGSTALSGALQIPANGSIVLQSDGTPWYATTPGNTFNIVVSAAVQVSGAVYYTQNKWG